MRFTASGSSRSFSQAELNRANGLDWPSNAYRQPVYQDTPRCRLRRAQASTSKDMRRRTQRAIPPGASVNSTPSPKTTSDSSPESRDGWSTPVGLGRRAGATQSHEDAVDELQDSQYWVVRTDGDPLALASAFRARVRSVDGDVSASNVRSMDQQLRLTIAPRRFNLQLLSAFAVAAVILESLEFTASSPIP